jgi:hypothetical protein
MNITRTHEIDGTFRVGTITATVDELIAAFGQPERFPEGDKVTTEWALLFDGRTVATIHDYKAGHAPQGVYEWSIGGKCQDAATCVALALQASKEKLS